jgi:diacylglycerol kinase family enzyme
MAGATQRHEIALLCNPRAGGRWRVLADVLDSEEARGVHRIVTDDIDDIREAIAGLGQRVRLLCIYGGDGTIFSVVNELLRDGTASVPRLAFLGGGTMNVTAGWLGMRRSPAESFRQIMRGYRSDRLLWREVPLLAVTQKEQTRYGFTFGAGPLVRILERYEAGRKSRAKALEVGMKSVVSAVSGVPRGYQSVLRQLEAGLTVDDERLPYQRWTAVFANVTGAINPFIEPFTSDRTRETFHFLAYAVSPREFAMMAPMLARGLLPMDARSLLHPVSVWRKALLSLIGKADLPPDPRYVNRPARHLVMETDEPRYTIDGEVLTSLDRRFDLRLGPTVQLATLRARTARPKQVAVRSHHS